MESRIEIINDQHIERYKIEHSYDHHLHRWPIPHRSHDCFCSILHRHTLTSTATGGKKIANTQRAISASSTMMYPVYQ